MLETLILNLRARDRLSSEEEEIVRSLFDAEENVCIGEDLVSDGDRPFRSTLLVEGIAARYKLLEDGTRQITALHIAGDFVDLHCFLLKTMAHGIVALTQCRVMFASHQSLRTVTENQPHLTRMLWLMTLIDGAIHREWLTAMGRRETKSQLAHLICEMFYRLKALGLVHGNTFRFPITQQTMADILGISIVHANKTLQSLRRDQVMTWKDGEITIVYWDRLKEIAEFDPAYLHFSVEPR